MPNLYRLKELTLFDFSYSLANLKSLAFIIPYFFFWYIFFEYISELAVKNIQSSKGILIFSWLLDNQDLVEQLFIYNPTSLSVYILVSISIMPLFIIVAANNQYSSDTTRGAFRFILTRATRAELYISRFISVTLLVLICIFITTLWASIQAFMNDEHELQTILAYGLQVYILLSFYSLPFIAFMSTVSTLTRSAFSCLFTGMMLYVLILTISLLLKDNFSYSMYSIPSQMKSTMIDINLENILISVTALSCYTLIYFGCGWFIFNRRDM
jgi:ABC-2 type transport system permease protein